MRSKNASLSRLLFGGLIAGLVCGFASNAFAQAGKAPTKEEKVDISDLENKYWAPKDTDFSVVQNRTYTKEKRKFFSLQYGIPTSDAYNDGSFLNFSGNYFFSERHGMQFSYIRANLTPNSAVSDLASFATGVYPDHGRMIDYWGVSYNFVPFYSKMSVMGKKIMYFDMAISPSLGMTKYKQVMLNSEGSGTALTYGFDITQYYFFSSHWAFRVDWKNQWYSQKVQKYKFTNVPVPTAEGEPVATKKIHDSLLLLGLTFFW